MSLISGPGAKISGKKEKKEIDEHKNVGEVLGTADLTRRLYFNRE